MSHKTSRGILLHRAFYNLRIGWRLVTVCTYKATNAYKCVVNDLNTPSLLRFNLFRALPLPVDNPIHDPPPHLPHLLLPLARLPLQPFQPFGFAPAVPCSFDCCGPVASLIVFPGQLYTNPVSFKEEAQSVFLYEQWSGDIDEGRLRVKGFRDTSVPLPGDCESLEVQT